MIEPAVTKALTIEPATLMYVPSLVFTNITPTAPPPPPPPTPYPSAGA